MNTFVSNILSLADGAAPAAGTGQQPSLFGSFWIFIPIFGVMYFLMIRPQQKRQKQQREMLSQLKAGDRVMTSSGALGTLTKVTEKTVRVAFVDGHEVDFVRGAIAEIIPENADIDAEAKK